MRARLGWRGSSPVGRKASATPCWLDPAEDSAWRCRGTGVGVELGGPGQRHAGGVSEGGDRLSGSETWFGYAACEYSLIKPPEDRAPVNPTGGQVDGVRWWIRWPLAERAVW